MQRQRGFVLREVQARDGLFEQVSSQRTLQLSSVWLWRDGKDTESRHAAGWCVGARSDSRKRGQTPAQAASSRRILQGTHDARREHGLARVDPVVLVAVVAVAEEAAGGVEATALGGEVRPVPALVPLAELVLRCLANDRATRQRARVRTDCRLPNAPEGKPF